MGGGKRRTTEAKKSNAIGCSPLSAGPYRSSAGATVARFALACSPSQPGNSTDAKQMSAGFAAAPRPAPGTILAFLAVESLDTTGSRSLHCSYG
jgi:hypothetical protein